MEYTYFGVLRSHFQNEVDLYEVTWRKNCKLLLKVKSMSIYAHSHLYHDIYIYMYMYIYIYTIRIYNSQDLC